MGVYKHDQEFTLGVYSSRGVYLDVGVYTVKYGTPYFFKSWLKGFLHENDNLSNERTLKMMKVSF